MLKGKEIINLHVGQAGCQLGQSCWEMYCLEHGIRNDGSVCQSPEQSHPERFFTLKEKHQVVPRSCFVDLEPSVIDGIRKGKFRKLFNPHTLLSGKEDAASCFARAYFGGSKYMIDMIMQTIRTLANDCDRLQGFLIHRGCGGGTGSGLTAVIIENLAQEFPKCDLLEFCISSSVKAVPCVLEPYNTAMAIHQSLEYTSENFIIENEACYDICDKFLDIVSPNFNSMNRLLGQIISSVTASFRFDGEINVDFRDLKTNLIPFPRVQHTIISYAPLMSKRQVAFENITEGSLVHRCFHPSSQLVKCDTRKGQYMTCTVLFSGDVSNSCVNASISSLRKKKTVRFVDWCARGFKVGLNRVGVQPVYPPGTDLAPVNRTCVMLANSSALQTVWAKLNRKFDLLYSKRAFVHWYLAEGLEEADFEETRLDLGALESDYQEIAE